MTTMIRYSLAALLLAPAVASATPPSGFDVKFTGCVESIGVDLVPTEAAQAFVPPGFVLAGAGTPVTPIVVRTARCGGIEVAGGRSRPGVVVQVGLIIVPPDFSGDVNIYTLWYYTTDERLARHLRGLGMDTQYVPDISYGYAPHGAGESTHFSVLVPRPGTPALAVVGSVTGSATPAGPFEAVWWAATDDGIVRMDTTVPGIDTGTADLTCYTPRGSGLGGLIGGDELEFAVLQQFNTFTRAGMSVRLISP